MCCKFRHIPRGFWGSRDIRSPLSRENGTQQRSKTERDTQRNEGRGKRHTPCCQLESTGCVGHSVPRQALRTSTKSHVLEKLSTFGDQSPGMAPRTHHDSANVPRDKPHRALRGETARGMRITPGVSSGNMFNLKEIGSKFVQRSWTKVD